MKTDQATGRVSGQVPLRGWNSYDCYGCSITEAEFRANVDALALKLLPHGYVFACIDGSWFYDEVTPTNFAATADLKPHLDHFGRPLPSPRRFPSAAAGAGFKPLADYVHSLGLKFGIHIMRGIPKWAAERNLPVFGTNTTARELADEQRLCIWEETMYGVKMDKAGAQAWYDSLLALYAEWGVDFIKADDLLNPYHHDEIEAVSRAVKNCGRPMVLSLSPGIEPHEILNRHVHVARQANQWRISPDVWDKWTDVRRLFPLCAVWNGSGGSSGADADMLPYGMVSLGNDPLRPARRSRLTEDEVRTHFTLLAIARCPLIFGGNAVQLDDFTLGILTNPEVLAVNEKSRGNRQLWRRDDCHIVWRAEDETGASQYLAVFNLGDEPAKVVVNVAELGLGKWVTVRDLWARCDLGPVAEIWAPRLAPHACTLVRLRNAE